MTLWLAALPVELEPVRSLLEVTTSGQTARVPYWHGTLRGCEICVALCGVGGEACESGLAALLDRWPCTRVLVVGLAGALNPALHVGDVVVASQAVSWSSSELPILGATGGTPVLTGATGRESEGGFRVVTGCVLSWHELVHDGQLKEELRERFGADCVDMETGHAARVCSARGVPFLAVRGISDQADESVEELDRRDLASAIWHATLVALEALPSVGS